MLLLKRKRRMSAGPVARVAMTTTPVKLMRMARMLANRMRWPSRGIDSNTSVSGQTKLIGWASWRAAGNRL